MKSTLLRSYNGRKDNVPVEVVQFITKLSKDFPPRCIKPNEDLNDHLRYAGFSEQIEGALRWLNTEDKH